MAMTSATASGGVESGRILRYYIIIMRESALQCIHDGRQTLRPIHDRTLRGVWVGGLLLHNAVGVFALTCDNNFIIIQTKILGCYKYDSRMTYEK